MRHFGLLAAFSIFLVFILNLTFVPALRELLDLRKAGRAKIPYKRRKHERLVSPITEHLTNLTRKKGLAVMIALVLGVIALLGWIFNLRMKASYDPTGELSKEFEVTRAYEILNDRFDIGTESVFIRINGDLTSPELWKDIQKAIDRMGDDRYVIHRNGEPYIEWILNMARFLASEDIGVALVYTAIDRDKDGRINTGVSDKKW